MTTPFIIDSHTHPFAGPKVDLTGLVKTKKDGVTLRFRHPEVFRQLRSNMEDATDLLIEDMDAAGIAMAVVHPATGGTVGLAPGNVGGGVDGVIAAVKRRPDRFVGLFNVGEDEEAIMYRRTDKGRVSRKNQKAWAERIGHWIKVDKLRGCGELLGFSKHSAPEKIAKDLAPLMEILADHKAPLLVATAWTQFASPLYHGVPYFVDDLAEAFPEVPIVITKMGRGYEYIFEICLAIAYKHLNVYLDVAQAPARHIARAVREIGADRVIYGTDWGASWRQANLPRGIYRNTLDLIEEAGMSEEERSWVLAKTGARLFGITMPA
jgi:predicted TIM-barrel fold metal-dependent hydrolase